MTYLTRLSYFFFFALSFTISFTSCKGDGDTLDNGGNNSDVLSLTSPCKYTISIVDTKYNHDSSDGLRTCTVGYSGTTDPNTGMATTVPGAGLVDIDLGYGIDISRGTLSYNVTTDSKPTNADFAVLFKEGDYSFSMKAADGFQLVFMDDDGVEWSSSKDSALANSNWLKIEESVSGEMLNSFFVTIKASFSCGIENDAGDIKGCSGSFTMQFENF